MTATRNAVCLVAALMAAGCATQNLSDAKRAREQADRAQAACNAGNAAACADYKDLKDVCGSGHAINGGLNGRDVLDCAAEVRRVRSAKY